MSRTRSTLCVGIITTTYKAKEISGFFYQTKDLVVARLLNLQKILNKVFPHASPTFSGHTWVMLEMRCR
jgi:hypothetical protein